SPNNCVQPSQPFPLNSNILLHSPIPHNLNHLNYEHLNQLTYLNSKKPGLLMEKKGKGKRRSTKKNTNGGVGSQLLKLTGIQNKNLVKAWIHVSDDRIKSNNQQLDVFWDSILDTFHDFCEQNGERVERTVSSLKNYWSDINCVWKVYGTCLKNAIQGPISGMQQENLVSNSTFVITNKF
ncbi:hypothetical protein GIB67_027438, partial [Kingdonia uniflora]